jgi:hypothetical protein
MPRRTAKDAPIYVAQWAVGQADIAANLDIPIPAPVLLIAASDALKRNATLVLDAHHGRKHQQ